MFRRLAIATAVSFVLVGCGVEEEAYDVVKRAPEEITVASLDTESLWMYMPSTGAAPRYAITQRGFFQGTPKLVTLNFSEENGLLVEEVDRDKLSEKTDSRWNDDINEAPVLLIPGEFRQYRCADDYYKDCTNVEEINKDEDVPFADKTHFVPKYEGIKSLARDSVDTWYTADNVEETASAKLISYEYDAEAGVINVEVERTFTASPDDLYQFGTDLKDLSFKTRFFYSLVKLDKLASADYQPVHYQGYDQITYGFFNDEKNKRSATGETGLQGQSFNLLNRFNPELESIDYYLSDSYHEEGNESFLKTTLDTIAEINKTISGTGVPPVKIVNPTAKAEIKGGLHTGDLRYNVLNLVTDPVDNGLLGYGPSATNPLTGEIVHAHVNQYAGVIRALSRRMWDEMARGYNREEIGHITPLTALTPATPIIPPVDGVSSNVAEDITDTTPVYPTLTEAQLESVMKPFLAKPITSNASKLSLPAKRTGSLEEALIAKQIQINKFAENNVLSEDAMWVSTGSKSLVEGIDFLNGGYFVDQETTKELKKWSALTAEQQKEAGEAISIHMYKSTLVHELGHNLGLRHNFMGSMDKANFYSDEEAAELGEKKAPAYSSVMDYAASVFDELKAYGKYDIAALRFGYSREIEALIPEQSDDQPATSKYIDLSEYDAQLREDFDKYPRGIINELRDGLDEKFAATPGVQLRTYDFCTDEHTTSSTICNRFDEGTDIKEVSEFRIQRYRDSYETTNRRNDRDEFYDYHQFYYALNRAYEFSEIRDVVEQYEQIEYIYSRYLGVYDTEGRVFAEIYAASCPGKDRNAMSTSLKSMCDTFEATTLVADFFIDVLSTPDKICETEEISGITGVPNRYQYVPLSDLWRTYGSGMSNNRDVPTTCYDPELVALLKSQPNEVQVRSETRDGTIEANLKANNPYQNTTSAIDLLGTWPDKLLAAQMLVKRDGDVAQREFSNLALIDVDGKVADLNNYVMYLAGQSKSKRRPPIFVDANGDYKETHLRYVPKFDRKVDAIPDYLWQISRYFVLTERDSVGNWYNPGVPNTPTPFFGALLQNLVAYGEAKEYGITDSAQHLVDSMSLSKAGPEVDLVGGVSFSWKSRNYVATRRNEVARFMAGQALYTPERKVMAERLAKVDSNVNRALKFLADTRNLDETRLVSIGDPDVIKLFKDLPWYKLRTVFTKEFKEHTDAETGLTCLRLNVEGESEAAHLYRKCNPKKRIEEMFNESMSKIDDDRFDALYLLANNYGYYVDRANGYYSSAKHKEVYDYDVEVLRLWISREYNDYREVFQQFPIK